MGKIHRREALLRKREKLRRSHELNRRIMEMAESIQAGDVSPSGDHVTSLHPCNELSFYPETKGKQRSHKKKMLLRDYRLPNPNGLKGLRITAEAKKATTQAIKKEQQVEYRRAQNMATRVRAGDQPYKATTYHMHRRRQAGKH